MALNYLVQGSGSLPYKITADGQGELLKIHCSCPAGRRAGMFCKHIQQILNSDTKNLIQPSDDIKLLSALAAGSVWMEKASSHVPDAEKNKLVGFTSIREFYEAYRQRFEAAGWIVEYSEDDGDLPYHQLSLTGFFKNGKPRKTPSHTIRWDQYTYDLGVTSDDQTIPINVHRKQKPYIVTGTGKTGNWTHIDGALHTFLTKSGVLNL